MKLNYMLIKENQINRYSLVTVFVVAWVIGMSLLLLPYYINGDQAVYISVYDQLSTLNFSDGFVYYSTFLAVSEVIHFLVVWSTSVNGIDKNLVMAVSNALLALYLMKLFKKWDVCLWIGAVIASTNFYMLVMYFPAERLKFGFLFLVISMLFYNEKKYFLTFSIMAILAHVETVILYASFLFAKTSQSVIRYRGSVRLSYWIIPMAALFVTFLAYLADHIVYKFTFYYEATIARNDPMDLVRIILFMFLTIFYSRKRIDAVMQFIPLIIAALLIGAERINMLGYLVFLYHGLQYKRGRNLGVILTMIYFTFKSVGFVLEFIEIGHGFDPSWLLLDSNLFN
jgi:hypothetical protein